MNKISICITTILKDKCLIEVINSILDIWQENWIILVGDQNTVNTWSKEKKKLYEENKDKIKVIQLPFNSGLSYGRNELVKATHNLGIEYCLIGADSIKFTEEMQELNRIIPYLKRYDLIGFDIIGRIGWEAKLELVENSHFELDFIETKCKTCDPRKLIIYNCDIVRNFFLAKTESLLNSSWDNNAKMAEHQPFFHEFKKAGYKVGYTNLLKGEYISDRSTNYNKLRSKNMQEGKKYFMDKYNLRKWLVYKNLERIRKRNEERRII